MGSWRIYISWFQSLRNILDWEWLIMKIKATAGNIYWRNQRQLWSSNTRNTVRNTPTSTCAWWNSESKQNSTELMCKKMQKKKIKDSHLKGSYHMTFSSPPLPSSGCRTLLWSTSLFPHSLFPICFPFDLITNGLSNTLLFGSIPFTCPQHHTKIRSNLWFYQTNISAQIHRLFSPGFLSSSGSVQSKAFSTSICSWIIA